MEKTGEIKKKDATLDKDNGDAAVRTTDGEELRNRKKGEPSELIW